MGRILFLFQLSHLPRLDDPADLGQHRGGIHRTSKYVQNLAARQAEITGDVTALLLAIGNPESADFLIRRNEKRVEVVAHFPVRQRAPTERLGIVSGEIGIFEVAGDVQKKRQFVVFARFPGGFCGSRDEIDGSPVRCLG